MLRMIRYESPKTRLHTYVAFSSAWLVDHNKRTLFLLAPFEPWMEQYERRVKKYSRNKCDQYHRHLHAVKHKQNTSISIPPAAAAITIKNQIKFLIESNDIKIY